MKYIKDLEMFFEDGVATATAAIGGMGGVVSPSVGSLPGVGGSWGSGDNGFVLGSSKKIPVSSSGNPSEVSDLRYLEPAKGVNKVNDFKKGKKGKKRGSSKKKIGFKRFSQM